jgi:hypothetical protein
MKGGCIRIAKRYYESTQRNQPEVYFEDLNIQYSCGKIWIHMDQK